MTKYSWLPIDTVPEDWKDGKREIVCLSPEYDGIVVLRWFKYNGVAAWRDWDADSHNPTHWHPLEPIPNLPL